MTKKLHFLNGENIQNKNGIDNDSSGKWLGQYETEDAAVEMLREMAKDIGGYDDEV